MAVRGVAGEMVGFGVTQAFRLVSTLVLSRLLYPEAFGLAALVSIVMVGLAMLSDTGLEQSVVQNVRGEDPSFLNTAWTIQVVRGFGLCICALIAAWPIASLYGIPDLAPLIAFASLGLPIAGVASTSIYSLRRTLHINKLIWMECCTQIAGGLAMISWAFVWPSPWAILAGAMVSSVMRTVWSHCINVGYRNTLCWDATAARQIFDFGKWIFGSSAMTFISRQADRMFLGQLGGMAVLGVYSMAQSLSEMIGTATNRLTHGVWFPVFSRVNRETPHRLRDVLYRARLATDAVGLVPLGMLMVMAETVVEVLYDPRYIEAGWMLRILCVRCAMSIVLEPLQTCLSALGHTRYAFYQNVLRSVWLVAGIPIAWMMWGLAGLVWATALAEVPAVVMLWVLMARYGLLRVPREALAIVFLAGGVGVGFLADGLIQSFLHRF